MSPEIIFGQHDIKGEPDFWAIGVILYRTFTKKLPFNAKTDEFIFDNVIYNKIDWKLLENKNIDSNLLLIIKGLLEPELEDRICSLAQIKKSAFFESNYFIYI